MKVYVDCVGCEQRKLDAQRFIDYLHANKIDTTNSPEDCDYAVLVTCAVDASNEARSLSRLDFISKALRNDAKLILGGCLPSISPEKMAKYNVTGTFSPRSMEALDGFFAHDIPFEDIGYPNRSVFDYEESMLSHQSPRDEYETAKNGFKVVISQGCLGECSYCVISKATGRLSSFPPEFVLKAVRDGIERGEKTVMLMAGDTGAYGMDLGIGFHDLLREVVAISGNYKVFIHDFNVNWLARDIDSYLDVFGSADGRRIRGANFPVQSGSDRILGLMKRPYRSGEAKSALKSVRRFAPLLSQGTHIMAGFPGETEEDFLLTMDLLEDVGFDFITCFPYSENPSAVSASLHNKVSSEVVSERLERIASRFGDKVKIMR